MDYKHNHTQTASTHHTSTWVTNTIIHKLQALITHQHGLQTQSYTNCKHSSHINMDYKHNHTQTASTHHTSTWVTNTIIHKLQALITHQHGLQTQSYTNCKHMHSHTHTHTHTHTHSHTHTHTHTLTHS